MALMHVPEGREASATRAAYEILREMILLGQLGAGQKLKIEDLRKTLDMGASPVREALSLLTSDMLVERLDQRGFRAAPASLENFQEILTLRCSLEDMALRQSMQNASPEWEDRLVLAHHRMKKETGTDGFEGAHRDFHMTLLSNAPSPILLRFCAQLYDLNIRYRYLAAGQLDYGKRDVASEHADIFEAAAAGDEDAAAGFLVQHYRMTGDYLSSQLREL